MSRGTHGRQGPPPDPLALRRDRAGGSAGWEVLPAAGRPGPPPRWPLSEQVEREVVLWSELWVTPQAVKWEENGLEIEVALHVRSLVAAEAPDATAASRVLVLRQMEHLGLSMPGLARNKWTIGKPEDAAVAAAAPAPRTPPAKKKGASREVVDIRSRIRETNGGS